MTIAASDTPAQDNPAIVWTGPEELRPLLVPITDLEPLPGNPRRGDVDAVARSLARFGQRKNITRRPEGITTAGNHTRLAAQQLGWTHLAVVTIDETDAEAKAWALADNRSSDLATNDDADLAAMLAEIQAADADLLAAASYVDADLDELLAGLADPPAPDPEDRPPRILNPWIPDPPAPRTRPSTVTVLQGDSRDVLAGLDENSIDSVVTDPPYGLEFMGKEWDSFRVDERSARWAGNERTGGAGAGFAEGDDGQPYDSLPAYGRRRTTNQCRACGKRDAFRNPQACPEVPGSDNHDWVAVPVDPVPVEMRAFQNWCYQWAVEAYRVLKPGGHLVAFGGSRTYHRLTSALEDVGFEIRDSLHWMYGSGFPKSLNVARQLGDDADGWEGWGTGLKPSHEPIVLARKPLDGTVAATVAKWGTGALNIDATRSPIADDDPVRSAEWVTRPSAFMDGNGWDSRPEGDKHAAMGSDLGRWPANVVLSHASGCAPAECEPACPVAALDAQSGESTSRRAELTSTPGQVYGAGEGLPSHTGVYGFDDSGGASRFFTQTTWGGEDAGMPVMLYVPKPSTAERNAGLDGLPEREVNDSLEPGDPGYSNPRAGAGRGGAQANFHPTVKPVALMRWLVRLVTPPLGTVLEPFTGSGTTLVAAVLEGFDAVGVELTADYLPIIEARVAWAQARCADVVGTPEA